MTSLLGLAVALAGGLPAASAAGAASLGDFTVSADGGHARAFAVISPDGDGFRDVATIHFRSSGSATVRLSLVAPPAPRRSGLVVFARTVHARRGINVVRWAPTQEVEPRTYVVRAVVRAADGTTARYGFDRPLDTAVIRVLGIDAAFTRDSFRPGMRATLAVMTHQRRLQLQVFRAGTASATARTATELSGTPVTDPITLELGRRTAPRRVALTVGDWPSGLYFAKLIGSGGAVGLAPFVVRPRTLGEHRVAVVMPTFTWQAYNFRDDDRDGYGDTWYAGGTNRVRLARPFLGRGVPPHFFSYDRGFLVWLDRHEREADFFADSDLAGIGSGRALARSYELIAFPGHHEYVTTHELDVVRGYRDRGGNLMFLSANNFFWRVDRRGNTLTRVAQWRQLGRPEAALIGVQYTAGSLEGKKAPYVVRRRVSWLFARTALHPGSKFGAFGIEIDATTPASPAGTVVIAEIRGVVPGHVAQMTYYETAAGAKVFAAGAFTLGGYTQYPVVDVMLENLWDRLSRD